MEAVRAQCRSRCCSSSTDMDIVNRYTHRVLGSMRAGIMPTATRRRSRRCRSAQVRDRPRRAPPAEATCCALKRSMSPSSRSASCAGEHGGADRKVRRPDRPQWRRQDHADALVMGILPAAQGTSVSTKCRSTGCRPTGVHAVASVTCRGPPPRSATDRRGKRTHSGVAAGVRNRSRDCRRYTG